MQVEETTLTATGPVDNHSIGDNQSESTVKGLKKCVSNNPNGSEDDILWKVSSYDSNSSTSTEDALGEENKDVTGTKNNTVLYHL